jgi:geranylgeranyl transferase type-2 subunit beta
MSSSPYLDLLDLLLRDGLKGASGAFLEAQTRFVLECRQDDGGFRGRQGGSDPYYTDFALRCLALLSPGHHAIADAKNYLEFKKREPASVVECFSFLNAHRLVNAALEHRGEIQNEPSRNFEQKILNTLRDYILPQGGFARFKGEEHVSAYHTFLGSLCMQLLGEEMPAVKDATAAIDHLRRPEGGYAEFAGQREPQTNATAAAAAFLMLHVAMTAEKSQGIVHYLTQAQSPDGGLKAHAALENGDLLSTFTGSLTLAGFDAFHSLDTSGIAEFLKRTAAPQGGFTACLDDDSPDVEYTYYGIATYCILKQFLQNNAV